MFKVNIDKESDIRAFVNIFENDLSKLAFTIRNYRIRFEGCKTAREDMK